MEPGRGRVVSRQIERYGSEYGGWDVCAGSLDADSVVYSFGAGTDVSFDLALIERFGLTVHVFDPSPRSIAWLKEQTLPAEFVFHAYGLADHDGVLTFYPPANPEHVSYSCQTPGRPETQSVELPVHRLDTIMKQLGHRRIDLLKMDIEGAEYGVIRDILGGEIEIEQLLVEFHHHLDRVGKDATDEAIQRLNEHGYLAFSVSPARREYSFVHVSDSDPTATT